MTDDIQKIIADYPEDYCLFLEATYGSNMLSEGGELAIDRMFSGLDLRSKRMLDIGFGLGGVAFYLARQYQAHVSGVEINTWMVQEATRRTPISLRQQVHFSQYHPHESLPYEDQSLDVVYSKGVLTHLQDKKFLFGEIARVLVPGGYFVVEDWLSPYKNIWGARLKSLCKLEGLTLYAETQERYICLLQSYFTDIHTRDENDHYYEYNCEIINRLDKEQEKQDKNPIFTKFSIADAITGYKLIAESIKDRELLIRWFQARRASI